MLDRAAFGRNDDGNKLDKGRGLEARPNNESPASVPAKFEEPRSAAEHEALISGIDSKFGDERSKLDAAWAAFGLKAPGTSAELTALGDKRSKLMAERNALPQAPDRNIIRVPRALTGEILGKDEGDPENPQVLKRFEELDRNHSIELGDRMRNMNRGIRRAVISDEDIIGMPYKDLENMALLATEPGTHIDDVTRENLMFPNGRPTPEAPVRDMIDVTPKSPVPESIGEEGKYLT